MGEANVRLTRIAALVSMNSTRHGVTNIDRNLRIPEAGLIIRLSTYDEVAALDHPLSRRRPAPADASRHHYFVAVRVRDSKIVASLGIEEQADDSHRIVMDWATAESEQRKGYASSCALRLAKWLHDEQGISEIDADVWGGTARTRTATKAGFRQFAGTRWRWYPGTRD